MPINVTGIIQTRLGEEKKYRSLTIRRVVIRLYESKENQISKPSKIRYLLKNENIKHDNVITYLNVGRQSQFEPTPILHIFGRVRVEAKKRFVVFRTYADRFGFFAQ